MKKSTIAGLYEDMKPILLGMLPVVVAVMVILTLLILSL